MQLGINFSCTRNLNHQKFYFTNQPVKKKLKMEKQKINKIEGKDGLVRLHYVHIPNESKESDELTSLRLCNQGSIYQLQVHSLDSSD